VGGGVETTNMRDDMYLVTLDQLSDLFYDRFRALTQRNKWLPGKYSRKRNAPFSHLGQPPLLLQGFLSEVRSGLHYTW
jgi:hypothetical protein